MTTEFKHQVGNETVTVHVTVLKRFEECKVDIKSPFKHMSQVTEAGFDPNRFENVFIKCEIYPENRTTTLLSHKVSGESVCHEVIEAYLKEKYPGRQMQNFESVFCNHFEVQYRHLVM